MVLIPGFMNWITLDWNGTQTKGTAYMGAGRTDSRTLEVCVVIRQILSKFLVRQGSPSVPALEEASRAGYAILR